MTDVAAGQETARRTIRVLLVEDDRDLLAMLATYLGLDAGIEICGRARNGVEALEAAESADADVAVMDLSMPVMDGVALLPKLRCRHPGLGRVVYSAVADMVTPNTLRRLGADAVVSKSSPVTALKAAVLEVALQYRTRQ